MLRSPFVVFSGFNSSMTLGVYLAVCWMLFRIGLCFMSDCSGDGSHLILIQIGVFLVNSWTILSSIPTISVFCNFVRKWVNEEVAEDFQVVGGLMGGLAVYYFLDDWKVKSLCMRDLTCSSEGFSGSIFFYLQTLALESCGHNMSSRCFRGIINLHWIGIMVATFTMNYILAHFLLPNPPGGDGGDGGTNNARGRCNRVPAPTTPRRNRPPERESTSSIEGHLMERVHQGTVTLLTQLGDILCPDCRDNVNEIIDRARE